MTPRVTTWLIGRGPSIEAGLTWVVPKDWLRLERNRQVELTRPALMAAAAEPAVRMESHRRFLQVLAGQTPQGCVHNLITSNWDSLLERALNELWPNIHPPGHWLGNQYVGHVNGYAEDLPHMERSEEHT